MVPDLPESPSAMQLVAAQDCLMDLVVAKWTKETWKWIDTAVDAQVEKFAINTGVVV